VAAREVALESKMKIGKPSEIAAVSTSAAATQATASQAGARAGSAPATGRGRGADAGVTVSVRSRSLVQAELGAGSEIDMNKVEAVRSAIAQGTFKINPEVIADKLLANAKDMLSVGRRA
jgi:negative regulator of flagellin synthesis FlgM